MAKFTPHRLRRQWQLEDRLCPAVLLQSFAPPDLIGPQPYSRFGEEVALGANYAVVGAPDASVAGAYSAGQAFVYSTSNQSLVASLTNPSPAHQDEFGNAVAVSGQFVMVGAVGQGSGRAYLYDMASADKSTPIATFTNPNTFNGNRFGSSIAMAGKYAVIGAESNYVGSFNGGTAYVYDLTAINKTTPIKTLDNPTSASNEYFGGSVALSGTRLVIGARGADTNGVAYIHDLALLPGNTATYTINNPTAGNGGTFGERVTVAGDIVAIGAPNSNTAGSGAGSVYVYNLASATPTVPVHSLHNPNPTLNANFGAGVGVGAKYLLIGAPQSDLTDSDAGAAYLYDLTSATPTVPVTINNPESVINGGFANCVAVLGPNLLIGSAAGLNEPFNSSYSAAYVYDATAPAGPVATLENNTTAASDAFGSAMAMQGRYAVVGAPLDSFGSVIMAGRAFVYDLLSPTPSVPLFVFENPTPAELDYFGTSVAISGKYVAVGAPGDDFGALNAGVVHVYDLTSATPSVPAWTLSRTSPLAQDGLGDSVAMSGSMLVVGAADGKINVSDFGAGFAYVYDLGSPTPTTVKHVINNPVGAFNNADFGHAVAISGNRVVIGAPTGGTAMPGGPDGIAYAYDLGSATPTIPTHTFASSLGPSDRFGHAVAISGTRLAVTAPNNDSAGSDAGSTFVYDLSAPTPSAPIHVLPHPEADPGGNFGWAARMSAGRLAVSARSASDSTAPNAVYVWDFDGPAPTTVVQKVENPTPDALESFGSAAALDGNILFVGAPGVSEVNTSLGAAYLFALTAPKVTGVVINGGSPQRSRVSSVAIEFDQPVVVSGLPSVAFQMKRQSDGAIAFVNAAVNGSTVTLTFTGGAVNGDSLADGRYTLTINSGSVSGTFGQLDGDGNGLGGGDYVLVGNLTNTLFRLYGDADGNGTVGTSDFLAFRVAFLSATPMFDFDGDTFVGPADFLQFRLRFLMTI